MFQYGQLENALFHVEHQHSDGSWGVLVPEGDPHDPAQGDPERDWQKGHVYVCMSCEERVRVSVPPTEGEAAGGG